jgi:hypothetical protein
LASPSLGTKPWKPTRGVSKVVKQLFAAGFSRSKLTNVPKNVGGLKYKQARRHGIAVDQALKRHVDGTGVRSSALKEVRAIIQWCEDNKIDLIGAQTPVADAYLRLGTCIDLVGINKSDNNVFIIEVKCGCLARRCTMNPNKKIHSSVGGLDNTLLHQHTLQVRLNEYLYRQTFCADVTTTTCVLIYAKDDGLLEVIEDAALAIPTLQASHAIIKRLRATREKLTTRKRKRGQKSTKNKTKRRF